MSADDKMLDWLGQLGALDAMASHERQVQRDAFADRLDRFADILFDERDAEGWLMLVKESARLRGIDVD